VDSASPRRALDLGCGAGFLANYLGEQGHLVTGIDTTPQGLAVARHYDRSGRVSYSTGDACSLPFDPGCFDAVCAMDLIEHVEDPERLVAEASRALAPSSPRRARARTPSAERFRSRTVPVRAAAGRPRRGRRSDAERCPSARQPRSARSRRREGPT
jgi:SAM-dependent methyltransferase